MPKKNPFEFNRRVERQYERELKRLARTITEIVRKEANPPAIVRALEVLAASSDFNQWAERRAVNMARSVLVANAETWRKAVVKGTESEKIFSLLSKDFGGNIKFQELIKNNAQWIKTIPRTVGEDITKLAAKEAIAGRRTEEIMREIYKRSPKLAGYKARRIARTEVAKANAAITELRASEAGVGWYIWRTVNDSRVRASHDFMEGILCQFDRPPSPERLAGIGDRDLVTYNPGGIYNCRCYAEPVVIIDQIRWPAKVYYGGRVVRMTRRQWLQIA